MIEPLRIAIVGHTNAGKSSIVAALTRRDELRISDEHGTTRDVDEWTFEIGGEAVLTFLDTPGFDRAGAINEWLDEAAGPSATAADDPDLVARFIAEADPALFRSEQRALSAVLYSTGTVGLEALLAGLPTLRFRPEGRIAIDILPDGVAAVPVDAMSLQEALAAAQPPARIERESVMAAVDLAVWRRYLTAGGNEQSC